MTTFTKQGLTTIPLKVWSVSAIGQLIQQAFPNACFPSSGDGNTVQWEDGKWWQSMLAMLNEAWQATMARDAWTNAVAIGPFPTVSTAVPGGEIAYVELLCLLPPSHKTVRVAEEKLYKLGAVQFLYGDMRGKLQRYNSPQQYFVPERPGATGLRVSLYKDVECSGFAYTKPKGGQPVHFDINGDVNLVGNIATGMGGGSTLGTFDPFQIIQDVIGIPIVRSDGFEDGIRYNCEWTRKFGSNLNDFQLKQLMISLVSEIWWDTAARNSWYTFKNAGLSPEFTYVDDAPNSLRYADVSLEATTFTDDMQYGLQGVSYFGYGCPVRNGFNGPLQYLNADLTRVFADRTFADGFKFWLKKPVSGSAGLHGSTTKGPEMFSYKGGMSLVDNILDGFAFP